MMLLILELHLHKNIVLIHSSDWKYNNIMAMFVAKEYYNKSINENK